MQLGYIWTFQLCDYSGDFICRFCSHCLDSTSVRTIDLLFSSFKFQFCSEPSWWRRHLHPLSVLLFSTKFLFSLLSVVPICRIFYSIFNFKFPRSAYMLSIIYNLHNYYLWSWIYVCQAFLIIWLLSDICLGRQFLLLLWLFYIPVYFVTWVFSFLSFGKVILCIFQPSFMSSCSSMLMG